MRLGSVYYGLFHSYYDVERKKDWSLYSIPADLWTQTSSVVPFRHHSEDSRSYTGLIWLTISSLENFQYSMAQILGWIIWQTQSTCMYNSPELNSLTLGYIESPDRVVVSWPFLSSQPLRDQSALRHHTEPDFQLAYEADTSVRKETQSVNWQLPYFCCDEALLWQWMACIVYPGFLTTTTSPVAFLLLWALLIH